MADLEVTKTEITNAIYRHQYLGHFVMLSDLQRWEQDIEKAQGRIEILEARIANMKDRLSTSKKGGQV